MSTAPPPKPQPTEPPQFSLRTILIFVAIAAIFMAPWTPWAKLNTGEFIIWGVFYFGSTAVIMMLLAERRRQARLALAPWDEPIGSKSGIYRDPRCVYVANNPGEADIIVIWLDKHEIPAWVTNQNTLGGLPGLTSFSKTGISPRGIEVWVVDPEKAPAARTLLAEHARELAATQHFRQNLPDSLLAQCDDCGRSTPFEARFAGTVQNCPHCKAHIDVPELKAEAPTPEGT
ncbi:MAG: DUF2007 domain-containing protein [Planctomycetia bacterium]|nr:DUF2007 domain-containing protein [Planctomycetia bacterium]